MRSGIQLNQPYIKKTLLVLSIFLVATGIRNFTVTHNPLRSPSAEYIADYTTAPFWFWQTIRPPQTNIDHIIERYDELVALPQSRWPAPAYKIWAKRLYDGIFLAGGMGLMLIAGGGVLFGVSRTHYPAVLLCGGVIIIGLTRYPLPLMWWSFAIPPVLLLAVSSLERCAKWRPALPGRILIAALIVQLVSVSGTPSSLPTRAEYTFLSQKKKIVTNISKTPGKHLVFVNMDPSSDANIEPADLPRDWQGEPILYARDLTDEKNTALAAALPDRTTWRITIQQDRIGLLRWPAPKPADAPLTEAEVQPPATTPGSESTVKPNVPGGGD